MKYLSCRCNKPGAIALAVMLFASSAIAQSEHEIQPELILTGQVRAIETQSFTVPWMSGWRATIQWMETEGKLVNSGDLVVVFDTSDLDAQIEQETINLQQAKDQAKKSRLELELKLIEAEHALEKARLENRLAKISADVPGKFRSDFEADNLKFELNKSQKNLEQAQVKYLTAKSALDADLEKQKLEVARIGAILLKKQDELSRMKLTADRQGTVLHAMHPWNGQKIAVGEQVQTSWEVASIPSGGNFQVVTWVNEVDWPKMRLDQQAELVLDAYPDYPINGKVTQIGQQAEQKPDWGKGAYYEVLISLDGQLSDKLFPGMSVRVAVSDMSLDQQLEITKRALQPSKSQISNGADSD